MSPPRGRPAAAKDRAYAHVKERILEGIYPGGELLSEGEVAAQLDMSRTPVREAFLLLEAEGLMRLYPKRGALVVPVSAEEINEVLETRLVIERHCAEQVARRDPEVLIAQLRSLVADQERHIPAATASASSRPTASSTARSCRPTATRSSSACTTRCASASAAWARPSWRATRRCSAATSTSTGRSSRRSRTAATPAAC